jgi:hypothetical protein
LAVGDRCGESVGDVEIEWFDVVLRVSRWYSPVLKTRPQLWWMAALALASPE